MKSTVLVLGEGNEYQDKHRDVSPNVGHIKTVLRAVGGKAPVSVRKISWEEGLHIGMW